MRLGVAEALGSPVVVDTLQPVSEQPSPPPQFGAVLTEGQLGLLLNISLLFCS